MKPRGPLAAVLAALAALAVVAPLAAAGPSKATPAAAAHGSQVVGYFIEWGIYGRNYTVKNVETSGSADG